MVNLTEPGVGVTPAGTAQGPDSLTSPGADAIVQVPQPTEQALRYHRGENALWIVGTALSFLIPTLFLFTGFSTRVRSWATRVGRGWYPSLAVYFIAFSLLTFVLGLPLAYYEGFVREHAYELSTQSLGKWFGDSLKNLAVGCIAGLLVIWIPYLLLRKSPRRWWLYSGLAAIPVVCFFVLLAPLWVDPLFNKFGPMKNKELETRILELAGRAGVDGARVFEVEKSIDTKTVNAYVAGIGRTKRIVLWDTLLDKLDPNEVLFVMGHEMGHYVLHHVLTTVLVICGLLMLSLYAVHRSANRVLARFSNRFGFDRVSDVASLPLLLVLGGAASFLVTPLALAILRHQEHEADRFALELTHDNRAAAMTFVKIQHENLSVPRPGPLVQLWRASHPALADRIDFANKYRPWRTGAPERYEGRFTR